MKLSLEQIRQIALGAVRIEEGENGVGFFRFTKEQEELYKVRRDDFYLKSFTTAGICLRFVTNSESLSLKTVVSQGTGRNYFSFDLFVNGEKVDSLTNFDETALPLNYTTCEYPIGEYVKTFCLGSGEKEVCLHFPWSVRATVKELSIDEGSFVRAVKPAHIMLCFGDSITHGYDALYTSRKYITQLANALDAEEHNKAIGGEIFFPELAATKEDFMPDYITVAYGTNDVSRCTDEEFIANCNDFIDNLYESYPTSKIFVLTPIWRIAFDDKNLYNMIEKTIREATAKYDNMVVIKGLDFVPHNESSFGDLVLHPNNMGFDYYANNLIREIKANLEG